MKKQLLTFPSAVDLQFSLLCAGLMLTACGQQE